MNLQLVSIYNKTCPIILLRNIEDEKFDFFRNQLLNKCCNKLKLKVEIKIENKSWKSKLQIKIDNQS